MSRYPQAEWVPWRQYDDRGQITYWRGANKPVAVVLHVMQGYASTARQWAIEGHYGASWHYTVSRAGNVMQHLEHNDAGYQAGIPASAPEPTWKLWQGPNVNVNWYTLGIEHEGFSGEPFTVAQSIASKALCQWLAGELDIALDYDHFPPHAEIDIVNRANDFNTPTLRAAHYAYLFEEDEMPDPRVDEIIRALTGRDGDAALARLGAWNGPASGRTGNSLLDGYEGYQQRVGTLEQDVSVLTAQGGGNGLPDHTHVSGGVQR